VVLDRFDHNGVLQRRSWHLHAARVANARVRDIAIAGDLVGSIDNNDTLLEIVS
jgi:hypothetical protein